MKVLKTKAEMSAVAESWRIENLDVVLHGRGGRGSWELYRQNFDTVDIRGIDPRATFVDTFKSLTAACAAI